MATNTINTRIALKYDLLTNWNSSTLVLKKGEIAIAEITSQNNIINDSAHQPANTPPAIAMKVGDGEKTFKELPWVQAVAGDVYAWAKKANAPTLGELTNIDQDLTEYINGIIGSTEGIQDTDTFYKVGSEKATDGKHKFVLHAYKKDGTTRDTSKDITINWSDLDAWMAEESTRVQGLITSAFSTLVPQEAGGEGKFVSAVDQVNGKIKVTRSNLVAADITDTIPQAKVAGLETIQTDLDTAKGQLANTDGTISATNKLMTASAVQTVVDSAIEAFDDTLTVSQTDGNYVTGVSRDAQGVIQVTRGSLTHDKIGDWEAEVTNKLALKQNNLPFSDDTQPTDTNYVVRKDDISDLAGAMHFEGVVSAIPPTDNKQYIAGDIVILEGTSKEYVYTGTEWLELGDEGSHASKAALEELQGKVNTLEGAHSQDVATLRGEITTAKNEAISTAQTNTENHVDTELAKLQVTKPAGAEKYATSVTQSGGKITVVYSGITPDDITGSIPQAKVANLETDLAGKQAKLAAIDGTVSTDNPVATKNTVVSAINASEAKLHAIATSGNVNDLVQTSGDVLFFDCGSSAEL